MTVAAQEHTLGTLPLKPPTSLRDIWRSWAHARLSGVFEAARELSFDDDSRIVFLSDCHRGNNSRADAFAPNEALFLTVLGRYYREGFTYIEVGDGDEVWKNPNYDDIVSSHPRTFDLLHKFHRARRLRLIFGNHDLDRAPYQAIEKDGLPAEEALILRHSKTNQRLFVVHGHQADFKSDALSTVGRFAVRHVWRRLQMVGLETGLQRIKLFHHNGHKPLVDQRQTGSRQPWIPRLSRTLTLTEERIMSWMHANQQLVICGHTHRPSAPKNGSLPYFNTGSCTDPGAITGLELQNGMLSLVRWVSRPTTNNGHTPHTERQLLAPPSRLRRLG
jgi:predicted phosphodiesterase